MLLVEVAVIDSLYSALNVLDGVHDMLHAVAGLFRLLYACVDLVLVVFQQAFDFLGRLGAA